MQARKDLAGEFASRQPSIKRRRDGMLVAGGYYFNLQEWHHYMFENKGLFTPESFHQSSTFDLVDLVILTNLKYCHSHAQQFHDWTLRDVFVLPVLNPRRRATALSQSIVRGLEVFDHHMKRFNAFTPVSHDPSVPDFVLNAVKLNTYVGQELKPAERNRYFPVELTK